MTLNKAIKDSGLLGCGCVLGEQPVFWNNLQIPEKAATSGTDRVARDQAMGFLALWVYTPVYKVFPLRVAPLDPRVCAY